MVATYAHTMPPEASAAATASTQSQGEHVQDDPVDVLAPRQSLGQVADGEPPGRVVAAEELGDVARATSANSSRRSYDDTRPCGPTARSSEQVSAPEPTPASTTWAPGKMSAIATIWAASLG